MRPDERLQSELPPSVRAEMITTRPALPLSTASRWLILGTAFLGWLFGGVMLQTTSLVMRPAAIDLLARTGDVDPGQLSAHETLIKSWWGYYQCSFLFGAATGGLLFGRLGDRFGRSKAMAASILCYSLLSAAASFVQTPAPLLFLWFLACLGVGGVWPNGVALLAETWSNMSRPLAAGIMGAAANVGILALATLATYIPVTPDHWRWVLHLCACPALLGVFVLTFVPESPRWLASQEEKSAPDSPKAPVAQVFRRPLLWVTLVGILLGTVPLFGGWGSANWMIPWADQVGERLDPPNPYLKAQVGQYRALPGIVGSFLGGWVGHLLGRRGAYFLTSVAALFCAQYAFWFTVPTDESFLFWVAGLGFFSGIYFGWLPLFLPELFPTRVRSTGAGVCFNFGRYLTAVTVFTTTALIAYYQGDYARIGQITSLIYAVGTLAIWLAPDTGGRQLED